MKTALPFFLVALVLAAGAEPPATGKVLVLDNERTLEGDIERVGTQYRVKRSVGVTWVPAEKVLHLCASREEAHAFLARRANLDDPDERLRLARWCHLHGLRDQALAEVRAAAELRPSHAETRRLLQLLGQAVRHGAEADRAPPTTPALPAARVDVPPVELTAQALGQFTTKVQPILMNACARCHVADGAGAFRLERTHGIGQVNRRATQQNLAAVLGQLDLRRPEASPFLVKAASAHGPTGEAPLKGRQAEALAALEEWVRLTLSQDPRRQDPLPAPRPSATAAKPAATPGDKPMSPAAPPAPTKAAEPADEFDPAQFNRQAHPDRKPAEEGPAG
jgi:hypothetical protein